MKKMVLIFIGIGLSSCATNKYNSVEIKDKAGKNCWENSQLNATGVSLIPGVGRMVATSMLKSKAKEYDSNLVVIDKEDGLFQVDIEATGYKCIIK